MASNQEKKCLVCGEGEDGSNFPRIRFGIHRLIELAGDIGDNELLSRLQSVCDIVNNESYFVHENCRSALFCKANKLKQTDKSCTPNKRKHPSTRVEEKEFEWKLNCFICGSGSIDDGLKWSYCEKIKLGNPNETRDTILELISKRDDEQADQIRRRLANCNDLPAADAMYHIKCKQQLGLKSLRLPSASKRGRPKNTVQEENFEKLCTWFEHEGDLYTANELLEQLRQLAGENETFSSTQYLKTKLKKRYGDSIFFAEIEGKKDVVCHKRCASEVINDKWYENRGKNDEEESLCIVNAAAKLIFQDIRASDFENSMYPANEMISDLNYNINWIPKLLRSFLEVLIKSPLKLASIGQAITHAVRPRSTIPPIQFGTAVELDHMFGSKWLLTELSRLGFTASPDEVLLYKQAVVVNEDETDLLKYTLSGSFGQWSADNVDHNVKTLDGKGSLHGMGIIISTTSDKSDSFMSMLPSIPRHTNKMAANDVIANKSIPLKDYFALNNNGLSKLTFTASSDLKIPIRTPKDIFLDTLWHASYFNNQITHRPGWNGYMQNITKGHYPGKSVVTMLPIIDLDPSNMSCIYSTLSFIVEQAQNLNINTPAVTFDQPLWIKAMDIVSSLEMPIVLVLGGFHMMMSFAGSIGMLMTDSGLNEALECVYGKVAIKHMMTGKSISRFVRANFIVEAALMTKLMSPLFEEDISESEAIHSSFEMPVALDNAIGNDTSKSSEFDDISDDEDANYDFSDVNITQYSQKWYTPLYEYDDICKLSSNDKQEIFMLLDSVETDYTKGIDAIYDSKEFEKMKTNLETIKSKLKSMSRTAKYWIQYMEYMQVLKDFIRAERTGNWYLHIQSVAKMVNLFAGTGHINYAKCARLYLQQMLELEAKFPWVYGKFAIEGYHTVRRSDRYWGGLWTDLTIEQVMM